MLYNQYKVYQMPIFVLRRTHIVHTHTHTHINYIYISEATNTSSGDAKVRSNATFSLLLPGKILNLTVISQLKKCRGRGNKPAAKECWKMLHDAGLGTLRENKARRGTDLVSSNLITTKIYYFVIFSYMNSTRETFHWILSISRKTDIFQCT